MRELCCVIISTLIVFCPGMADATSATSEVTDNLSGRLTVMNETCRALLQSIKSQVVELRPVDETATSEVGSTQASAFWGIFMTAVQGRSSPNSSASLQALDTATSLQLPVLVGSAFRDFLSVTERYSSDIRRLQALLLTHIYKALLDEEARLAPFQHLDPLLGQTLSGITNFKQNIVNLNRLLVADFNENQVESQGLKSLEEESLRLSAGLERLRNRASDIETFRFSLNSARAALAHIEVVFGQWAPLHLDETDFSFSKESLNEWFATRRDQIDANLSVLDSSVRILEIELPFYRSVKELETQVRQVHELITVYTRIRKEEEQRAAQLLKESAWRSAQEAVDLRRRAAEAEELAATQVATAQRHGRNAAEWGQIEVMQIPDGVRDVAVVTPKAPPVSKAPVEDSRVFHRRLQATLVAAVATAAAIVLIVYSNTQHSSAVVESHRPLVSSPAPLPQSRYGSESPPYRGRYLGTVTP